MSRISGIPFAKLHGCGNSFIVLWRDAVEIQRWREAAVHLCSPAWGIGSDGLMVISPSSSHDFFVQMVNPDGSAMGMCGNGIRCVLRYLNDCGRLSNTDRDIAFDVEGRDIRCRLAADGVSVRVDMGAPATQPKDVPVTADGPVVDAEWLFGDRSLHVSCVSMGNPHCVIFVPDSSDELVVGLGPQIECDARFPKRTNVEFVELRGRGRVKVGVWERGAGRTLACGTGACAVVVAGVLAGKLDESVVVELPGGTVEVEWDRVGGRVFLTGPTEVVADGVLRLSE